jgi:hypothetical protein
METDKATAECYNCSRKHEFSDYQIAWAWADAHQRQTGHIVNVRAGGGLAG